MGCCLSREEDRFDASEALLPKAGAAKQPAAAVKNDEFERVDAPPLKPAAAGSYKSPEPTLTLARAAATEKHNPAAAVESVDLLGLHKAPAARPQQQPSKLSAQAHAFQPHGAASVATTKPAAPAVTAKSASPPKPAPATLKPTDDASSSEVPQLVGGAARPVEVTVAHVAVPDPVLVKQEPAPPKPLERKKSGSVEPTPTPTPAPASVASTDDVDNDENDDEADKAPSSAGGGGGSKKSKKKKKKGKK